MDKNWHIKFYDVLDSTNTEALKFCNVPHSKTVVCAKIQTAGRGRRGRQWISEDGNLFFSQALEFDIRNIGALVLIVSLSVWEAIRSLSPAADVKIKWPNDVLLNNAKVCGILLEKGTGEYIIIGVGVNIAHHPQKQEVIYPTTSLAAANIFVSPQEFLHIYLQNFEKNMQDYEKYGISFIMKKWLQNAQNLHKNIAIRQENKILRGVFSGIDENACLLLEAEGKIEKVYAGDMLYGENDD